MRTISPGSACRPSFDFSNTGRPSWLTSKRPPPDGISSTRTSGNASVISAANLVARGSYVQTVQYSIVIVIALEKRGPAWDCVKYYSLSVLRRRSRHDDDQARFLLLTSGAGAIGDAPRSARASAATTGLTKAVPVGDGVECERPRPLSLISPERTDRE